MNQERSNGIMLPEVTDELLNEVLSDAFLDEMMKSIFVETKQTEFKVNGLQSDSTQKQDVDYGQITKLDKEQFVTADLVIAYSSAA
ncbi:hypothetical protein JOC36_000817 [Weissella uvarum]|uniref:hypothetical protein n=1 Tax=Bacilli TaxID=91061 RepID=UPI001961AF0F|nr:MULTISPECIES: hypothetical protein [Bacilli]MBM7617268.1 hypothetical protein [Weissella uvarum]MCM0595227.1 hypothetical protein [Weissella uvarum]MCM0601463.1 hypothetical protein [Periweissella ghanensis]MDA5663312.1 hypothetical protein [Staphylococcus aureus]